MIDRADEIAREIAVRHGPAMSGGGKVLAGAIAAALRSYGDGLLEDAALKLLEKHGRGRGDIYGANVVRSLKSKPEAQDTP